MSDDIPDSQRIALGFLVVLSVIIIKPGCALAPAPPEVSDLIIVQESAVQENTSFFRSEWQVLGTLYWEDEIDYLLGQYDWDLREANHIMFCESSSNATRINWKDKHNGCIGSFGLFQLACFRGTQEELLDPATNIKLAYELWKQNGWRKDWVNCSRTLELL